MRRLLSVILLVLLSLPLWAYRPRYGSRGDEHYFGIYAEGGYSLSHPWKVDLRYRHGYGLGAGFLYEYEHGSFLLDAGIGFTWQESGYGLRDKISFQDKHFIDTHPMDYTLDTYIGRYDMIRRGVFEFPLMLGGQSGAFYGLVGLKFGVGIVDRSYMHSDVTTCGVYDKYIVPIHETDNHGYRTDVPIEQSRDLTGNLDARLSIELGGWIGEIPTSRELKIRARVAFFADYGIYFQQVRLNNVFLDGRYKAVTAPDKEINFDFDTYRQYPIMTPVRGNHYLHNLFAGVKVTVLFGGSSNRNCPTCRMWDDRVPKVRYKNHCVICNDNRESDTNW